MLAKIWKKIGLVILTNTINHKIWKINFNEFKNKFAKQKKVC